MSVRITYKNQKATVIDVESGVQISGVREIRVNIPKINDREPPTATLTIVGVELGDDESHQLIAEPPSTDT